MPERRRGRENAAVGLQLTLPVELFTDPFAPLLAHLPDSAGVANVSTLQGNLRSDRAGRDCQRVIFQQQMHPKPRGLSNPPEYLVVPGPCPHRASLMCLFRKQHFFTTHKPFIQNSHFIAVRRREEPPSKDTELSGGDLGCAGQGKPGPGSFCCPTSHREGGHRGPSQAQVRSFGPHSHSGQDGQPHTSLK